ncbi:MFS transporter [Amycolatopsis sp. NPDC058986]|uniref:MFS transporter n=1 Tax=unclassified Amycolatopsis TaxID=2618356 RepID=UPI003672F961
MAVAGRGAFAAALASAEFRAMWLAETLSVAGDQLARVALALVVYGRTNSASLTALTYALTFAPAFIGGFLLSGLADRFPRRAVIVVTDVVRGCLALVMAIPGLPLPALWCLVGALTLAGAPFKAAQLSLLPDVLPEGHYQAGLGLRQISTQTAQVIGFGLGGILVTAIGASGALVFNGGTFLISALVIALFVHARPAARRRQADEIREPGQACVFDRRLVAVFILASLIGLLVVPEGLAAPFAGTVGAASFAVGVLMAADPVGSVVGGWWASRGSADPTARSVIIPAIASGLPLVLCVFLPGLVWAAVLWAICGALSTVYLIRLQAVIVAVVPDSRRGAVMGKFSTCVYSSQGVAITGAGVVADQLGPVATVAVSGALASVLAAGAGIVWRETRPRQPRAAEDEPCPVNRVDRERSDVLVTHGDPLPGQPAVGGPGGPEAAP